MFSQLDAVVLCTLLIAVVLSTVYTGTAAAAVTHCAV
jgi:hypothetical protein